MKDNLRKITAFTAALALMLGSISCGRAKNEESPDSQESSESSESSAAQENEKTVVTVANVCTQHTDFLNKAKGFETDKYKVNFINYLENAVSEAEGDTDIDALARETLQRDMISGECPDVIVSDCNFIMTMLDDGYFTDLYPLMDAGSVPREEFLPNVLEGFEREGRLPVITAAFNIYTTAAKTEYVGKEYESWTLDEMKEIFETLPEGMQTLRIQHTSSDLPNFMFNGIIRECINLESNTCDFHGAFLEAFDFIDKYNIKHDVKDMTDTEQAEIFSAETDGLKNGTSLLNEITINGINNSVGRQIYDEFGGADITYTGYPTAEGSGAVVDTESMQYFAVMENSDCKEGAWEFICEFFSEGYLVNHTVNMGGIPVIESAVNSALEYNKWNSSSINSPFVQNVDGEILSQIDEKSKQAFREYITTVEINPYFDTQLYSIAREEYLAVINGEKSPEEAADILENRISLYLNERG